jgi:hypothetical protein
MTVITQKELDSFRSIIQQKLQIQAREDILRQITDQNNRL